LKVGYPRVLALLDELDLRGTFFIEGWNGLHHPDRCAGARGARSRGRACTAGRTRSFGALDKARAEQLLYDGTASLERIGLRPQGFRAPGGCAASTPCRCCRRSATATTASTDPEVPLDAAGVCSRRGSPTFPWSWDMVDSVQYLRHPVRPRTPQEMEASWRGAIENAILTSTNITIVIHAFVSGVDDERFAAVRRLLTYARQHIEVTTAGVLAEQILTGGGKT
jgi:peptidoglycan-N-acetylglucosamine deacetylase